MKEKGNTNSLEDGLKWRIKQKVNVWVVSSYKLLETIFYVVIFALMKKALEDEKNNVCWG